MSDKEILSSIDHTQLGVMTTPKEILMLCDEALKYGAASVCIPACYIKLAKEYAGDKMQICTVIGFPNGYSTTEAKCFETCNAIANGADEIDMVINVGMVKAGDYDYVYREIKAVREASKGKILKVIIEACLLTDEEKRKLCAVVSDAGADFIKTSTGFSNGGATLEDIKLFKKHISPETKIKAAGGIRTMEDARAFVDAGADRIGASAIIKALEKI